MPQLARFYTELKGRLGPDSVDFMPKRLPRTSGPSQGHLVVALVYDGLCTFEFGTAVEVFGLERPEVGPVWYRFAVCGLEEGPLRAIGGFNVLADGGIELLATADTIIIPGWRDAGETVPAALCEALRASHDTGTRIIAICSGSFVLAAAGLLDGRRVTTHWRHADNLARVYPAVQIDSGVLYVDDGDVLTSAGAAAGIDLCLHVVRRDFGPKIANLVARRFVMPPHREGAQTQYLERPISSVYEAARLGPLMEQLRNQIHEDHSIPKLASSVGMSLRTFIRRFKDITGLAPGAWIMHERLSRARELLETSPLTIEEVASASGFQTAAALRHHFRLRYRIAPTSYRSRFASRP